MNAISWNRSNGAGLRPCSSHSYLGLNNESEEKELKELEELKELKKAWEESASIRH